MKQNNLLLTGYKKSNKDGISSTEVLLDSISEEYNKFLFTNDFEVIVKEVEEILEKNYKYIIMFGWKPQISKLVIEIEAAYQNNYLFTNFLLEDILAPLKKQKLEYVISEKSGNSFCNWAYYHVMDGIKRKHLNTKVIFIHIPYIDKFKQMKDFVEMFNNYVVGKDKK